MQSGCGLMGDWIKQVCFVFSVCSPLSTLTSVNLSHVNLCALVIVDEAQHHNKHSHCMICSILCTGEKNGSWLRRHFVSLTRPSSTEVPLMTRCATSTWCTTWRADTQHPSRSAWRTAPRSCSRTFHPRPTCPSRFLQRWWCTTWSTLLEPHLPQVVKPFISSNTGIWLLNRLNVDFTGGNVGYFISKPQ